MRLSSTLLFILAISTSKSEKINHQKFSDDFMFGTASSSAQIEGAWDIDGKGSSMWDYFSHNYPENINDRSNADVACNSYYKNKEDVQLLKKLGVDSYRFSISWSRVLPNGFANFINQKGVDYYNDLINELIANNITPMVTMYHWELPQVLSELGGFANEDLVNWYKNYARVLFENFGDRVKIWMTFNEPRIMCDIGYGTGRHAPGIKQPGISNYICTHNLLKAHAHAYRLYETEFKQKQQGRVGIVVDCQWFEPGTNLTSNVEAAERQLQFDIGRFLHPIISEKGDYPGVVKKRVAERSEKEGFSTSRLPKFSNDEILLIKNSADFLGVNHYTTYLTYDKEEDVIGEPSHVKDSKTLRLQDPSWPSGKVDYFKTVPWALKKVLKWLKQTYRSIDIYITENGYADSQTLDDLERIDYHESYLRNVLDAIYEDNVPIKGYSVWSFMDVYEWDKGYTIGFGLYYVNFTDPDRPRIPKKSVEFYSSLTKTRTLSSFRKI